MNNEALMMSYWIAISHRLVELEVVMNSLLQGFLKSLKLNKKSLDKSRLAKRKGPSSLIDESYRAYLSYYVIWRIRTLYGYVPLLPLCIAHVGIDRKNKTKIILVTRVSNYGGLCYVVLEIIYFFLNFFLIVF